MTDQQTAAIHSILRAAPTAALRRVVRQPERLWKAGGISYPNGPCCLIDHLEDAWSSVWGIRYRHGPPVGKHSTRCIAACAFDDACAADGLRATVREVKRLAREEIARRG